MPRDELKDIVGPITRELQHNGVVDRPLTEEEVLALLESCYWGPASNARRALLHTAAGTAGIDARAAPLINSQMQIPNSPIIAGKPRPALTIR